MRKNRFLLLPLALVALTISLQAQSTAGPTITPCVADTLQDYMTNFNSGNYCNIGIMLYNSFDFGAFGSSEADVLDTASDIYLSPVNYGFKITQTLGDPETDPFIALYGTEQYNIFYQFTIDPGPVFGGSSNSVDPPAGLVSITQYYCNDSYLSLSDSGTVSCTLPGTDSTSPDSQTVTTADPTGTIIFRDPAQSFGNILTQINLDADDPAQFDAYVGAGILSPDPAVPEPGTIALGLGGLVLIWKGRRVLGRH